jgi:hypothetical protein
MFVGLHMLSFSWGGYAKFVFWLRVALGSQNKTKQTTNLGERKRKKHGKCA